MSRSRLLAACVALATGLPCTILAAQSIPAAQPAGPAVATSVARPHLHALPATTRIRLSTPDLPERSIVGMLVRIDSTPSLTYVVQNGARTWSIPRSAVVTAAQHTGTVSHTRATWRVLMTSALIGTATGALWEEAEGGDRRYARTIGMHIGVATAVGMLIGRRAARETWSPLELPD